MTMHMPTPDFTAVKQRQQAMWATGDYALIGTTLQIVGERLCEAMDLQPGSQVLDVAAGNGNATLAAARRFADVTSTDYVGALLERGRERAEAERQEVTFMEADAEALPFADAAFDAVMSTFGVMFTPDHETAASEMLRVTRKGGTIGLANWTAEGFIGQLFKTIGRHVPSPQGIRPASLWGTRDHLEALFAGHQVRITPQVFTFRYKSPEHWLEIFRTWYGPTNRAFAALDDAGKATLAGDILELLNGMNSSTNGTLVLPGAYVEVIVTKH